MSTKISVSRLASSTPLHTVLPSVELQMRTSINLQYGFLTTKKMIGWSFSIRRLSQIDFITRLSFLSYIQHLLWLKIAGCQHVINITHILFIFKLRASRSESRALTKPHPSSPCICCFEPILHQLPEDAGNSHPDLYLTFSVSAQLAGFAPNYEHKILSDNLVSHMDITSCVWLLNKLDVRCFFYFANHTCDRLIYKPAASTVAWCTPDINLEVCKP